MNIVHFTDTYYPLINGVSVTVEQLTEVAGQNNNVLLIAPSYSILSRTKKVGRITYKYIRSIPFPIYPGVHAVLPNLVSLYRILKEFKPDVFHIHTPFVLGILGTVFSQILGVKLVGTYHTLFSMGTMYISPKRLIPGTDLTPNANNEQNLMTSFIWRLQVIFFNICDAVIAPTKIIAQTLHTHGIKTKITTLPNGIKMADFPAKKSFTTTNRIIHLGRLGYEKSIEVVLKAFAKVQKSVPKATLVLVGSGPAENRLKALARELKIGKYVEFLGMLPHEKTSKAYQSCDFFVTASTFETQGLVLIEAMLSGLPIVAAAVNAPCDLIGHGENGFLFNEGDVDTCAEQMTTLLQDTDLRKKMALKARKYAEQFDINKTSQRLLSFYRSLLTTRQS